VEHANQVFEKINKSTVVNFKELDYISSAGLSVLLVTQKRLSDNHQQLKLINMNNHIRDVFKYAGFDMIFEIG
jgi:anti-sigma B factor antagonist